MNDIDKMPVKCRDCPYWELAIFPWCCGDCKDIMNPKNGEYIKRIDAKRALTALSADLDAETVQRCVEAMNIPKAADVEPKQKWISVEDELPEDHRMVLCYTPVDGYICVGFCLTYDWGSKKLTKWNIVTAMRSTKTLTKKVTHWMEIPVPPKEEKDVQE